MDLSKITITPIGTCRVNTPLKRGATRYPIQLDYRRTYGFVHTSEEVLQQMRYRSGELVVPDEIKPLLFRPGYDREWETPPTDRSDLTIVEISSSKSCLIGDLAVQTNYVIRHFNDLLSAPARARAFWDLIARDDRQGLAAFLSSPVAVQFCAPEDRDLLSQLTFHKQTFDEVFQDMSVITDLVGRDRLLFVTHVNGRAADGELIASRDRLIRWVTLASERLGVRCFDPTDLMLEMGQERALEKDGLDLTHFTNAFYDRWYAHVQREYILPHAGDAAFGTDETTAEAAILTETIATAIEFDDFFDGTRQMFAALKTYPDFVPLQLLHGQVLARIGDYQGASQVFADHLESADMTAETRQSFMRVLLETGQNESALSIARQMLTDEYENDEIYEIAGIASERLGQLEEAIRFRKLAFRFSPSAFEAAIWVLEQLLKDSDPALYDSWLQEVVELTEAGGNAASARAIAEWALVHNEADAFSRAFAALAQIDTSSLPRLIDEASDADMSNALAKTASGFSGISSQSDRLHRAIRKLAKGWVEEAAELMADDKIEAAAALVSACLTILPTYGTGIQLQRELIGLVRGKMADASDDPERLIALCSRAGGLIFAQKGTALMYAKALLATKRWEEAQRAFAKLHQAEPDDINIKASLAHVAASNGDFMMALKLNHELASLGSEGLGRFALRVERFMANAEMTTVRQLRSLTAEGDFASAIELAALVENLHLMDARLPGERERIRKGIRGYLRQRDEDGVEPAEALELLKLMLIIAPDEGPILRRAALEAMKLGDFAQALEFWERLDLAIPDQPTTLANINRCQIFIKRMARMRGKSATVAA